MEVVVEEGAGGRAKVGRGRPDAGSAFPESSFNGGGVGENVAPVVQDREAVLPCEEAAPEAERDPGPGASAGRAGRPRREAAASCPGGSVLV